MKKLLVLSFAMAGATTLLAVDAPVAGFESYETGDMSITTAEDGYYFWDTTNLGQQTGSIVEYSGDGVTAPEAISLGNNKYFHVDSGSDTVLRNSVSNEKKSDDQGYEPTAYEDLGKYMDAYVQFTAADEPESLAGNADKIRFYLLKTTDEQEKETLTFHVCAGKLATALNTVTPTDYAVTFDGITPAENTWYRLVIKTIANISGAETTSEQVPGFVIFLDGKAATCSDAKGDSASAMGKLIPLAASYNDAGTLFPSMISTSNDNSHQKLIGLGFRGTGNVDNIAFTTAAPADYAADPKLATPIELYIGESATPVKCDNFEEVADALEGLAESTDVTIKLGKSFVFEEGGELEFDNDIDDDDEEENAVLTIDLNGNSFGGVIFTTGNYVIKDTAATAGTISGITVDDTLTIGPGEIVAADAIYVTGTLNILSGKYAEKPSVDGGTLKLPAGKKFSDEAVDGYYVLVNEGGSETPTVEPGKDAGPYDDSAAAAAAAETAVVTITDTDAAAAGQAKVAKVTVKEDNGKFYLTVVVNTEANEYVDPEETMDAVGAQLSNIAGGTVTEVTIPSDKLTPGLYYYFSSSAEVDGTYTDQTKVLATGNAVTLQTGDKPSETAGFYKVNASLTK